MVENGCFNLTNPQRSIWNMESFFEGTCICNVCTVGLVHEDVDTEKMVQAINSVVKKNDSFRLVFDIKNGEPVQRVAPYKAFDIEITQVTNESELHKLEQEAVNQKFEIIGSCLYNFKIAVMPNKDAAIILTVNHIIADSWSLGLVIQAIIKEYHAIIEQHFTGQKRGILPEQEWAVLPGRIAHSLPGRMVRSVLPNENDARN